MGGWGGGGERGEEKENCGFAETHTINILFTSAFYES